MSVILITGSAGFIGFHTAEFLLKRGDSVVGVDNLNDYYDPDLKNIRNAALMKYKNYIFYHLDICDHKKLMSVYREHKCDKIIHLAAQAGVRYSCQNPFLYEKANIEGFLSVLEVCRHAGCKLLIFASSSSVYGANSKIPFSVNDPVSKPISFYGATKLANEAMAYSYYHLFNLPVVGLRFFTVYGPFGRPDMAYFKFADAIMKDCPIDVYNNGNMVRSFTYITDAIAGVGAALNIDHGYSLFNIGNPETVKLVYFIECLEKSLGKKAVIKLLPLQDGDMVSTSADITETKDRLGFEPRISIEDGVDKFCKWFLAYKNLK